MGLIFHGALSAQKYQWVYEFPSMSAVLISDESKKTRFEVLGTLETGIYFQKKYGISIGHAVVRNDISEQSLNNWLDSHRPEWKSNLERKKGMIHYSNMFFVKFNWRLLNTQYFTVEPNLALSVTTAAKRKVNGGNGSIYSSSVGGETVLQALQLKRKSNVYLSYLPGLLVQANIKHLGVFCNVGFLQNQRRLIGVTEFHRKADEESWTKVTTDQIDMASANVLTFEFGLRVTMDRPFNWLNLK